MSFAQNLKYCMDEKNYSAYKLAQILGCHNQSVLNWEKGDNVPHKKMQIKIAEHFGITLEALNGDELPNLPFEREKEQKEKPVHNVDELDEETKELRNIWDTSDADERQALLEMARLIKKRRVK